MEGHRTFVYLAAELSQQFKLVALEADLRTAVDAFLEVLVVSLSVLDQAPHVVVPLPQLDLVGKQAVFAALWVPQERRLLDRVLLDDASEVVVAVGDDDSLPELLGHWDPRRKIFL